MKSKVFLISVTLILMMSWTASGQENELAPQILTSDLIRTQTVEEQTKEVSFVIVDSDNIVEVSIDGEPQVFEPNSTVVIDKTFTFKKGKSIITVVAVDEKGNKQEKTYLVGFQVTEDPAMVKAEKKADKLFWKVQVGMDYEIDDNPTLDFSSPIDVEGLDIQGVVPDNEQPDNRQSVKATLILGLGKIIGIAGINQTTYAKSENEFLNSLAVYLGAGYRITLDNTRSLLLNFLFLDINVGTGDYSQNQIFSPAFQSSYKDSDGFYRHLFGLDYTIKSFADSNLSAGNQMVWKWEYNSLDAERLDNFKSLIAYGSGNDGTDISKNTYYGIDLDWENRWESGFKWDLGFGLKYINYENEPPLSSEAGLGSVRVDLPFRFSNAFGLQFTDNWYAKFTYDYTLNLSNKNIYVRTIQGISVAGAF